MSKIFVRVQPRIPQETFFRCAIQFSKKWTVVEGADAATIARLREEQMLEVSDTVPADLETDSPNAAGQAGGSSSGDGSGSSSTAPTDPAERLVAIKAAIAQLDKDDKALWMKNGQPQVAAIVAITGWAVTAAERNEAAPAAAE